MCEPPLTAVTLSELFEAVGASDTSEAAAAAGLHATSDTAHASVGSRVAAAADATKASASCCRPSLPACTSSLQLLLSRKMKVACTAYTSKPGALSSLLLVSPVLLRLLLLLQPARCRVAPWSSVGSWQPESLE